MIFKKKNFSLKLIGCYSYTFSNKKLNLYTTYFWKTEYIFFKNFSFLNYILINSNELKFLKNEKINLYILFIHLLKCNNSLNYYFTSTNFFLLPKLNCTSIYNLILLNYKISEFNYKVALYWYLMFNFFNKWKIIEYFFIPSKFLFNRKFLLNKNLLSELFDSYYYIYLNINKNFLYLTYIIKKLYFKKIDFSLVFFLNDLIVNTFKNLSKNVTLFDNNLTKFLSTDWVFRKSFFNCLTVLPNKYDSFWSLLNVSLLFTTSFLYQMNIAPSGFDIRYLKFFNLLFLKHGDAKHFFEVENLLIWGFKNVIYRWGSPYQNVNFGDYKNNLFINVKYYSLPTLYTNFHKSIDFIDSPIKKKHYDLKLFSNYIFINTPYITYSDFLSTSRN